MKADRRNQTIFPQKIRILLTVPHLSSDASPYREMMAIAKYLPKDRFELTICSLRRIGIEETGPGLEKLGVSYFIGRFRIKQLREIKNFIICTREIKLRGPFDIQHSFDFTTLPLEAIVARINGRKFIHQQRNLNEGGHIVALKIRLLFSNKIIPISRGVQTFLLRNGIKEGKIRLIHNGLDTSIQDFSQNKIDKVVNSDLEHVYPKIIMVSQIIPRKKIEDAIKVVGILRERFPGIRLNIIGHEYDAHYKELLGDQIQKNQLEKHVRFLGTLKNDRVLEEMSGSDIFLHCAEKEAFGWVLVEAFSQNLPVVAAESEGALDIVDHGRTGLLYEAGNIDQLKENLEYLLDNPDSRKKMTELAYQDLLERFSAQAMVENFICVYKDILQN